FFPLQNGGPVTELKLLVRKDRPLASLQQHFGGFQHVGQLGTVSAGVHKDGTANSTRNTTGEFQTCKALPAHKNRQFNKGESTSRRHSVLVDPPLVQAISHFDYGSADPPVSHQQVGT